MALSRWLHTSSALLFDPASTRLVSVLERKLVAPNASSWWQKVVHATATKMVLCTGKIHYYIYQNHCRMSDELDEKSREEFNKIVSGYVLIDIKHQMNKEMDESSIELRGGVVEKHVGHRMFSVVSRMCKENRELQASAFVRMCCVHTCLALGYDGDVEEWVSGLRENLQRILNGVKAPPLPNHAFLANVFCRE